jgi:hypothetical protein
MSMSFSGPKGSVEQRWIVYALLRDCVQHHLEGGAPSPEFEALHSMGQALGGKRVVVPARKLHEELTRARAALSGRPIQDLAISTRTHAVISLHWPPPAKPSTSLVEIQGSSIPLLGDIAGDRLDDVFGNLLDSLLQISEGAGEADQVEVRDN